MYVNAEHITYVDSFGVYIPKEIRKYIGKKILQQIIIEDEQTIQ